VIVSIGECGGSALSWENRLNIATDIAQGSFLIIFAYVLFFPFWKKTELSYSVSFRALK